MCSKIKRIITKVKKEGIVKPIERRIRNQQRQKEELKIIRKYHLIEDDERKRQREEVFDQNIKISVITPLYNTPELTGNCVLPMAVMQNTRLLE